VTSIRVQRAFAWSGLVATALFLIGLIPLAHWVPPPAPTHTAKWLVHFFMQNTTQKRIGMWMETFAGALSGAFCVAITMQLRRAEGERSTPLAYLNLIMGALLVFEFIIPVQLWQACLYRPAFSPSFTYRLNDFAWIFFVGVISTATLECLAIGFAVLFDRRAAPVFPRWIGYLNLWCAALFLPGSCVVFFKTGPLAWNGILAWWLVLAAFSVWLIVMSVAMLWHSIPQEERELRAAAESQVPSAAAPLQPA
jgi:hypothetical protein